MGMLERPAYIWFRGRICPWDEAVVHVWSELATRGANVFEGIRCYRQVDGKYAIVSLDQHMDRLEQSAKLFCITNPHGKDELIKGIYDLINKIKDGEHLYIRPTIYVEYGRYGDLYGDAIYDAYIVAVPVKRSESVTRGIKCCVSSYRRSNDLVMSPLIKAGAAYQSFRLPAIEARRAGYDDAILLNQNDYVSETTGASIFIVKDDVLITPSLSAGILDSITRQHIIELAVRNNIKVIERDITRMELYTADEVFATGTLCEITPIIQIDMYQIGDGKVGDKTKVFLQQYFDICEGRASDGMQWLNYV